VGDPHDSGRYATLTWPATLRHNDGMSPRNLVFVHAHPDDEALLTAGTMARAASEGHRVVLIVATNGEAGLASATYAGDLGRVRRNELERSASALGVSRIVTLDYQDSGLLGEIPTGFCHQDVETVARRIAEVCTDEAADILVGYDAAGGYGHPDHVHVHRAVRTARGIVERPVRLFEATLPREPIARAARLAARSRLAPPAFDPTEFDQAWTPRSLITHRVDVRPVMDRKIASLRAHASQASADGTTRTLAVLTRLPRPLRSMLLGTEFYVEAAERTSATTSSTRLGES
jgi:LmbE family N-acetylglucosaminyl deacetylase